MLPYLALPHRNSCVVCMDQLVATLSTRESSKIRPQKVRRKTKKTANTRGTYVAYIFEQCNLSRSASGAYFILHYAEGFSRGLMVRKLISASKRPAAASLTALQPQIKTSFGACVHKAIC